MSYKSRSITNKNFEFEPDIGFASNVLILFGIMHIPVPFCKV